MKAEMNFDNIGGTVPDLIINVGVVYGTSGPRPLAYFMRADDTDFPYNKVQYLGLVSGNGTARVALDGVPTDMSVNQIVDISSWSSTLSVEMYNTSQNNSGGKFRFFVG